MKSTQLRSSITLYLAAGSVYSINIQQEMQQRVIRCVRTSTSQPAIVNQSYQKLNIKGCQSYQLQNNSYVLICKQVIKYRMFTLSCPRERQLCRAQSLLSPGRQVKLRCSGQRNKKRDSVYFLEHMWKLHDGTSIRSTESLPLCSFCSPKSKYMSVMGVFYRLSNIQF